MSDERDSILKVVENDKLSAKPESDAPKAVSGHTNPLTKKFLEFHSDKENKLKVKDLFKK